MTIPNNSQKIGYWNQKQNQLKKPPTNPIKFVKPYKSDYTNEIT